MANPMTLNLHPAVEYSAVADRRWQRWALWFASQSRHFGRLVGSAIRLSQPSIPYLDGQAVSFLSRSRHQPEPIATELSIALVDTVTARDLNQRWRDKSGSFNVIAFPMFEPDGQRPVLLGDIVICLPYAIAEATRMGRSPKRHLWALWIHGLLHLLGHDHQTGQQQRRMQTAEYVLYQQARAYTGL